MDIDKLENALSGLSSLSKKIDKLDIANLESTPVNLSKLSYVAKNIVVKKTLWWIGWKMLKALLKNRLW